MASLAPMCHGVIERHQPLKCLWRLFSGLFKILIEASVSLARRSGLLTGKPLGKVCPDEWVRVENCCLWLGGAQRDWMARWTGDQSAVLQYGDGELESTTG